MPVPPVPQVSMCDPSPIWKVKDFSFMTLAAAVISISLTPFSFKPMRNASIKRSSTSPDIMASRVDFIARKSISSLALSCCITSSIIVLKNY